MTSLACDPDDRTLFYTTDNNAYRDLVALDPRTRKTRVLLKDARIGDLAFNRADRSLWGVRHLNGICTLVRIPHPYTEWNQVPLWPYGEVVYDLDVSPDGRLLSASVGEINGRQSLRVMKRRGPAGGRRHARGQVRLRHRDPLELRVLARRQLPLRQLLLHRASRTSSATSSRRGALEAVSNTETGFFRPIPLGGDALIVFRYTGEGFVPALDRGEAAPGRERDHVPRASRSPRSTRSSRSGRSARRRPSPSTR